MDKIIEKKLQKVLEELRQQLMPEEMEQTNDPVAKMMLVALLGETQKIADSTEDAYRRIADRFCADFIPSELVQAMPAIALIKVKADNGKMVRQTGSQTVFNYAKEINDKTEQIGFVPIFNTLHLPPPPKETQRDDTPLIVTNKRVVYAHGDYKTLSTPIGKDNTIWVGLTTAAELESLQGLSLLFKGTQGVAPVSISIGEQDRSLQFATMQEMEQIEMVEPFDAQQSKGYFFAMLQSWKDCLQNMDKMTLVYITDPLRDRDIFKPKEHHHSFKQSMEDSDLQDIAQRMLPTVWLQIDFQEGFKVPEEAEVQIGVIPVVNINVETVKLTKTVPFAKLHSDSTFFLGTLENSTQVQRMGYGATNSSYIVRDFDATPYHNGDLYRDVRNLYHRFVDDYHAFAEYNGIKDGKLREQLRNIMNKLGENVDKVNKKYLFDSGVFAMRHISLQDNTPVVVNYLTTQGKKANSEPETSSNDADKKKGNTMRFKSRAPGLQTEAQIIMPPSRGADKASPDRRYELLRYVAMTGDRLYTKMDVEAFLQKEVERRFEKKDFNRIHIKLSVQGVGGERGLQRGLYIDIEFDDKSTCKEAMAQNLFQVWEQMIKNRSCIPMPIIVKPKSREG